MGGEELRPVSQYPLVRVAHLGQNYPWPLHLVRLPEDGAEEADLVATDEANPEYDSGCTCCASIFDSKLPLVLTQSISVQTRSVLLSIVDWRTLGHWYGSKSRRWRLSPQLNRLRNAHRVNNDVTRRQFSIYARSRYDAGDACGEGALALFPLESSLVQLDEF